MVIRDKDTLKSFNDITRLWQFLYVDEKNRITVLNAIGAELELRMDEEGYVFARVTKAAIPALASEGDEFSYDDMLSVPIWLGIIEQLQNQPSSSGKFKTRWDEIKFHTGIVRTLNSGIS